MSNQKIPFGIGTDIVEINRFREKFLNKNKSFYQKIFLKEEIEYCLNMMIIILLRLL